MAFQEDTFEAVPVSGCTLLTGGVTKTTVVEQGVSRDVYEVPLTLYKDGAVWGSVTLAVRVSANAASTEPTVSRRVDFYIGDS